MDSKDEADDSEHTNQATSRQASPELGDREPTAQLPASDDDAAHPEHIDSDRSHPSSTEDNAARLTTYLGDTRDKLKAAGNYNEDQIRKILKSLANSEPPSESGVSGSRIDPFDSSDTTPSSPPHVEPHLHHSSKSSLNSRQLRAVTMPSASAAQSSASRNSLPVNTPRGQSMVFHTDHLDVGEVPQSRRLASDAAKSEIKDVFSRYISRYTQQVTPSHSTSPTNSASPLLNLPPELRNRIYRFALIEPNTVHVHRAGWSFHQPALLKSCRQIRHEALGLFYLENKICTEIRDWSPAVRTRVNQLLAANGILSSQQMHHRFKGEPNWANLLAWLKDMYEGRIIGISDCVDRERALDRKLIGFMFMLVRTSKRHLPWPAVQNLLEAQRGMLGMLDRRWLR